MSETAPRCNTCWCWERNGNTEFGVCTLITRTTLADRNGADSPFARAYCSVETHERFGCVLWEPHDGEEP